jgi:hypothetical protein
MACDAKCQEEAAKRREVGAWSSPEREALLRRIRPTMADATTDDLLEFARVELNDALDNVDPIEGGSEFHAGCCMMRAEAAIYTVQKRMRGVLEERAEKRCKACLQRGRVAEDCTDRPQGVPSKVV